MTETDNISFKAFLIAISFWLIFITIEGSFSVQILTPILLLLLLYDIVLKKNSCFKISKSGKILGLFVLLLGLTSVINSMFFVDVMSIDSIIGILYFIVIFLWYVFTTNQEYNAKEIKMMVNSYIYMSLICSLFIIYRYLGGQIGKIAMVNLINVEIDENYVSALIAAATLFLFNILINRKQKLKGKLLNLLILTINLFAIALSGSRAALISTAIATIISLFVSLVRNFSYKKIMLVLFAMFSFIILGSMVLRKIPAWTFDRYFNSNYADNSNNIRLLLWENGINGILNRPFTGYGITVFDKLKDYGNVHGIQIPERVPAHQTFLDIGIYCGIGGILLFIYFLYTIFIPFIKKKNIIYLPVIVIVFFIMNILGAERSVFLWNNLVLLSIINHYLQHNNHQAQDII